MVNCKKNLTKMCLHGMGDCYLLKSSQGKRIKTAKIKRRKRIERSDGLSYQHIIRIAKFTEKKRNELKIY